MSEQIKVGLIGFGNVGQGVYRILSQNHHAIQSRLGADLLIKKVAVRSVAQYRDLLPESIQLTDDVMSVIEDPDITIVVEAIGGDKPAYDYIKAALNAQKFVVTANKEVISKHKQEFFALARKNNVDIYFEASVGGGMPVIRSLKVGYSANLIQSIYGILNGTCNYILTKIEEEGLEFKDVLKDAQEKGFAEADPHMDISGLDAAYKLVILAAVAFKVDIQLDDVHFQGIESVTLKDVTYAKDFGYAIRLLATGRYISDEDMAFKVYPTLVPLTHPLAHVRNEFNALFTTGNAMGEAMIYGKGAGSLPTGSAVVSDIIDIAFDSQVLDNLQGSRNLEEAFHSVKITEFEETSSKFYLRIEVQDSVGVLEKITHELGQHKVSVNKILQKEASESTAEIVVITHRVKEALMTEVLEKLSQMNEVLSTPVVLHVGLDDFYPRGLLE